MSQDRSADPAVGAAGGKKRVLILVENLSVPFDRRVFREASALVGAGYSVTVICPRGIGRDRESRDRIDGIDIRRYRPHESATSGALGYFVEFAWAILAMFGHAVRVFFRSGIDIIQICNPPDLLFFVALPFKLFGTKIVFDHHDLSPELFASKRGAEGGFLYRLLLFFERITFSLADRVLSTNESFREIALLRGGKPASEVVIVRNGPALSDIRAARPDLELRKGSRFLLVYVGMMGSQDGVDLLLRAVRELAAMRAERDFRLVLFGDGPELPRLEELRDRLEIADIVDFRGRVSFEDVLRGISAADICMCPDPKTPMNDRSTLVKVVEYMGLGKPVVAFDLKETRCTAGGAAAYARPNSPKSLAECANELLVSAHSRKKMGDCGRLRVENSLAWDYSERQLLAVYEGLTATPDAFRDEAGEKPAREVLNVRGR